MLRAIKLQEEKCQKRLSIAVGVLFEFDQATLTPGTEETLAAPEPQTA